MNRGVALVTGSRTGLGRAMAVHLLEHGYTVIGCSRGAPGTLPEGAYAHVECDVADEAQVVSMVRGIARDHGRLDVVVNNAGVASMNHALLTSASTVDRIMATNVRGTFLVSRECVKVMQRNGFGRVVNLGSVAVPLHLEGEAIYASSKAAVETLTRVFAREVAPLGVTVNCISPGPIRTDLLAGVPEAALARLVEKQAVRRLGEPRDVHHVLDFFLSPAADFITGQVVYLGGVS